MGTPFIIITIVLYGGLAAAIALVIVVSLLASREFIINKGWRRLLALAYFGLFILWWSHVGLWFWFIPADIAVTMLARVAIVSVMSDVIAFFMGNYLGRHPLPQGLNNHKSWEGVIGQIVGAGCGGLIAVFLLDISLPVWMMLLVGIASAIGDLFNSAAKRTLLIKDWGATIPGHGGVMDRLASLSLSIAFSLWAIPITMA